MNVDRVIVLQVLAAAARAARMPLADWVALRRQAELILAGDGINPEQLVEYLPEAAPVSEDVRSLAEAVLELHPADVTSPRCEWCAVAEQAARILGRSTARPRARKAS